MKPSKHLLERAAQRDVDFSFIAKTVSAPDAIVADRSRPKSKLFARKCGGQTCVVVVENNVMLTTYWANENQARMFERKSKKAAA